MLATDRDAVICDLAETYRILDYRALPVRLLAVLASGLRENSRIKLKMSGMQQPMDIMLQAASLDTLNLLFWSKTKDAEKNKGRPKSVLKAITNPPKQEEDVLRFRDAEHFRAAWKRMAERKKE